MITINETHDHKLIAALNEQVQQLHHQLHPGIFKPYDAQDITAAIEGFLKDINWHAFVAMSGDEPVGYGLFVVKEIAENAFHYRLRSVYIDQILVLDRYRHLGIGKMLLDRAEQLARELSINKMELEHWSTNTVAASYLRKNGYSINKERLFKVIE